jgi:hypothetical protein
MIIYGEQRVGFTGSEFQLQARLQAPSKAPGGFAATRG